ncbi:glycosyl transferase family 2 [Nocardioides gansuensis]|uniref:Glycosyl transferase family 2 n=1 Tax=Nocardioides gansuensis TaxID=2138300 RepID=A0A2T8FET9_9ACTN|nr:glycosyltransferase [Nocardioides gansuensis]PVG84231.1 glycosyl transferase family 2 [Nocardioides gansuensis]
MTLRDGAGAPPQGGAQPLVRRNDWGSLAPPALGEWTPRLSVSVVVPTYAARATLPYVLAGLAAQSYPAHLLEVVVVDDGNSPPVELPDVRPERTRVVRVESGWGRANACHTGALAGDGEVIHWLDSDMLVFREHVEAQLRWHHLVDYTVVLGTKRFVDPAPLLERDPADVRDLVAAGRADELWDWDAGEPHKWVEGMWRRTGDLTEAGPRAFRAHVGATGSLTRALYDDAGGMDTALILGEDMELGHRLAEAGGVLVPEHAARAWHLGRSHVMEKKDDVNRHNDSFLANLVPGMRPKRNLHGRTYDVPYLEVVVDAPPSDELIHCVDAVLDSTLDDLRVVLPGSWHELHDGRRSPLADPLLDLRIVERTYRHDPRVELVPGVPPGRCRSSFRLTLDSTAWAPTPVALQAMLDDLERTHEGTRIIRRVGRLDRTAAVSRVARALGQVSDDGLDAAFGLQVLASSQAGFVPTAERDVPRHEGKLKPPVDPAESRARLAADLGSPGDGHVHDAAVGDDVRDRQDGERRGLFGRRL